MQLTRKTGFAVGLIMALLLALVAPMQAQDKKAKANPKDVERHAMEMLAVMKTAQPGESEKIALAMRELTAMGADVVDFMIDNLGRMDDISGIGGAVVLGEIDDIKAPMTMLKTLENSKFKGEDDPRAHGAGAGMGELTRNLRDGFLCLSLALQAFRLDRDNPEELKLYTQIRDHLRTYLKPENKRKTFVRMAAVMGLGFYLMDSESVDDFCRFAKDEKSVAILRVAAVLALSNFCDQRALDTLEEIANIPVPEDAGWKYHYIQKNAALALGSFGDKDSLAALKNVLKNKHSAGARNFAWVSIAELGPQHGEEGLLEFLKEQLKDERDLKVRTSAIYTMYQMGEVEYAVRMLDEILFDSKSNPGRLTYASQILGFIQDEKARDLLLKCLNHPMLEVRRLAVSNLIQWCGDPAVRDKILAIAEKEKDDKMKQQALLALTRMDKSGDNLKLLAKAATANSNRVKRAVSLALANCPPDKEVLSALLQLISDNDMLVSDYAMLAFGTTAWGVDPKLLKAVEMAETGSPYYMVRRDAKRALTAIKDANAAGLNAEITDLIKGEAFTARGFWSGHYSDMVNLMLQAAIMETRVGGDVKVDDNEVTIPEPGEEFPETVLIEGDGCSG